MEKRAGRPANQRTPLAGVGDWNSTGMIWRHGMGEGDDMGIWYGEGDDMGTRYGRRG